MTPYPSEIGKTQQVRLLDVFFIGPLMIWVAGKASGVPQWATITLAVLGVLTIGYNAHHFIREELAHGA